MSKDFWDHVEFAETICEGSDPRFICIITHPCNGSKNVVIYLDERLSKKATLRRFYEQLSFSKIISFSTVEKDLKPLIERIVDDLFDKFGTRGFLEWDPNEAKQYNLDWQVRLLRKDLKRRCLPKRIPRECLDQILNEIYLIEPVLES